MTVVREKATAFSPENSRGMDDYLEIADIQQMFGWGASKTRLFVDLLPHTRIGRKYYVLRADLDEYLATHDSIDLKWPSRKRR